MPRLLNRLGNAKQVAALKEPGWHADGGGLYLRIRPGGTRAWVLVKVDRGKRQERGLGPAASVTLARAREVRDNPTLLDEAIAAPEPVQVPTFGDFTHTILADLLPGFKNAKHRQQWTNTLKTYAAPIAAMRVDVIATDDVLECLRPIWLTKSETAGRVRGRIERILGAAKAKGHRPRDAINPAAWDDHLEHFLPKKKRLQRGHHGSVPWRDMPTFWAALAARRGSASVEALRFTILTAGRTGEVIGATWAEVDLKARTWTVPKERMKMGIEHVVPLSDPAIAVLKRMKVAVRPEDHVFPGLKKGKPLSNMAMLKLLQGEMGREETVHGFRSSFRDWAGDATAFPRELAEQALAHAIGDAAEQAYRRGTAIEKRRPLMKAWAEYLAG